MSLKDTDVRTPGEKDIAKKFKLSLSKVRQLIKQGAEHEKEHNTDLAKAKQVARDHIGERPDYYQMLKKAQKTKVSVNEEDSGITDTSGVRGLGYITSGPAVGISNYCNTNTMSYEDQNSNNLEWIKKKHIQYHNKIGYNFFDPTKIKSSKNFVSEGISAGPEREIPVVGDLSGGSRKVSKESITKKLYEAVKAKAKPKAKTPAKKEGGSSYNEVMGRVYERATVLGMHERSGARKNRSKEYLAKIAELQQKQAADLKKLPASVRASALKSAESSVNAYIKSLAENHGVDVKDISEVHHTSKGIDHLIGRNVLQRDNPHDMVIRIGKGANSRLHGASLKKTQGTLGNNSHVQFSEHGKSTGIGHQTADIWNAALEKAGLKGVSKKDLKLRQGDKKVIEAYKAAQKQAIAHHTDSFNAASSEKQREHLKHLMKLNFDSDVPYDYVNGEKGYAKPVEKLDHAQALSKSKRFAAVSRGTSTHIFDDEGKHILTVEHRATHGPFSSMQANAKLGSLKTPKGEKIEISKEPEHPMAHADASKEASQIKPEKVKKLLSQYRETRTPETKKKAIVKTQAQAGPSPIAQMPKPGVRPGAFSNNISRQFNAVSMHIGNAIKALMEEKKMKDPCWKGYEMVGMKKKKGRTVPNCVPKEQVSDPRYTERPTLEQNKYPDSTERGVYEDWQSVNRKDKTDGLSQAAVNAYRRENPGSKLKTAVTEKNPTGKRAARRKSFCSRMGGMKKRLTSAKTARDPDSNINKALRRWNCEESVINEISAELVGRVSNARYKQGKAPSPTLSRAINKKFVELQLKKEKETGVPFAGSHKRSHEKSSTHVHRLAVNAMKQYTKEETTMDNKDLINEAVVNILENNLVDMKTNLMEALQEKVMEKLEEKKKIIASEYFAQ